MKSDHLVGIILANTLRVGRLLSASPVDKTKYQNHKNDEFATIEGSHINCQQRIDFVDEGRRITWQICVLLAFYGFRSTFMRYRRRRRLLTHSIDIGFIYNFFSFSCLSSLVFSHRQEKFSARTQKHSLTIFVPYLVSGVLPRPQEQKKKKSPET